MSRKILYVDNRVKYVLSHRIPWLKGAREAGLDVHVTTLTSGASSQIEESGFRYHDISGGRRSNNPLSELRLIFRLYRLYKKLRPDIIHHITLRSVLYGCIASTLIREPRIVNGVTGLGYLFSAQDYTTRALRTALLWVLRLFKRSGQVYLFQNPDDERLFRSNNIVDPSASAVIKGSGVDTDTFDVKREPSEPPVVLFPARMLWHKGIDAFVEAARSLKEAGSEARFVLVGDTDPDNPAAVSTEQLQQWEAQGIVEWWGYQDDMSEVFGQSHIVCLPSAYREGVPKVLIEAASCGRPIVTTDMPGCREIVKDGENGILVPPRDGQAVADAIARLINDRELRREMGKTGRRRVCREFSVEHVVNSTIKVYDELLATSSSIVHVR